MISEFDLYAEELRKSREKELSGIPAWARAEHLDRIVPQKELWRPIRWAARKIRRK